MVRSPAARWRVWGVTFADAGDFHAASGTWIGADMLQTGGGRGFWDVHLRFHGPRSCVGSAGFPATCSRLIRSIPALV